MTLQSDITTIQDTIDDIETVLNNKGVYYNGSIVLFPQLIKSEITGIPLIVENGVLKRSATEFNIPPNVTTLGNSALRFAFHNNPTITSVNFNSITTMQSNSMDYAFAGCPLTSLDLSSVVTINGAGQRAFQACTSLTTVDLSSLTTISGSQGMYNWFVGCTSLTTVDLSSLTTISSTQGMYGSFLGCTSLTTVDLSSLTTVSGSGALSTAFQSCTSLTTLSFPALTSKSFGSYTDQFNNMLKNVSGCTVHFPSNLQSIIGSWASVTGGFGGTNTTVLFDLPATT